MLGEESRHRLERAVPGMTKGGLRVHATVPLFCVVVFSSQVIPRATLAADAS